MAQWEAVRRGPLVHTEGCHFTGDTKSGTCGTEPGKQYGLVIPWPLPSWVLTARWLRRAMCVFMYTDGPRFTMAPLYDSV